MVEVPNLEYAADEYPPTCNVLPVSMYEAEAVPWTSNVVWGAVVRIPTRLLVASIERVLVLKERPLTPPDKTKLVSLAKVQEAALAVTVSPEASPKVVLPFTERLPVARALPLIVRAVPTMAWALSPLEIKREPAKEEEPVPEKVLVP